MFTRQLWGSRSAVGGIANRKNASWNAAAELRLLGRFLGSHGSGKLRVVRCCWSKLVFTGAIFASPNRLSEHTKDTMSHD
jgi:hypothetical protein